MGNHEFCIEKKLGVFLKGPRFPGLLESVDFPGLLESGGFSGLLESPVFSGLLEGIEKSPSHRLQIPLMHCIKPALLKT
jgi:hypothetical protein